MSENQIQEYLFQQIREKLPVGAVLVDAIAEKLFVSIDSAYRRIRGETPLVLEEAKILCEAFSLSLDELLGFEKNRISFAAVQLHNEDYSFKKYLEDILAGLQKLSAASGKQIIYLTKDIPVFYNFLYRPVFSFRYFFWMKSILQHPDFVSLPFSIDLLPKEIESLGSEISKLYGSIASTEIWNTECINSTIAQVEYYREAGYFRSEADIEKIYQSLGSLIEHIREQAGSGCKFLPGENAAGKSNDFHFFYNRVVLGDNTIMSIADGRKTLYLSYDVLNYMITTDEKFCDSAYEKLQMLMRRGTILSNTSEKQRNIFFNILLRKIPSRSNFITHISSR